MIIPRWYVCFISLPPVYHIGHILIHVIPLALLTPIRLARFQFWLHTHCLFVFFSIWNKALDFYTTVSSVRWSRFMKPLIYYHIGDYIHWTHRYIRNLSGIRKASNCTRYWHIQIKLVLSLPQPSTDAGAEFSSFYIYHQKTRFSGLKERKLRFACWSQRC